jgi:putative IMPACT (imprinted ancient) family translation regulator
MPIYGQIQSFNLTNVLIVVVRYFGGVKLGVSGLINAYKTAAQLTVENATIIEKTINQTYGLHFDYKNMNTVMRIVKEFQLNILQQDFKEQCYLQFEIRKRDTEKLVAAINSHFELVLIPLND